MYNISKLNNINPIAEEILGASFKIADKLDNPDGILVRSAKMHSYEVGDNLLAVGRAGAGVNNIPLSDYAKDGIVVFNTPGANANGVKELVICGLLLSCRGIVQGCKWATTISDKGSEVGKLIEAGKNNFAGTEIRGKTLGLIGLGAIGGMVANSAIALGMKVVGFDPYLSVNAALALDPNVKKLNTIDEVYKCSDFISIHSPLLDSTRGMINTEAIGKMKDNVKIINCARGELVINDDIKKAIKDGKVSSYVVDFPNEELLDCCGVIAIPHLGASTEESETNCAIMVANQLKEFFELGNVINSVNYPNLTLAKTGTTRITITAKKCDKLLGIATEIIGDITGSANATNGDYSYIIIDTNCIINDKKLEAISELEGAIKVRVI